MFPAFIFLLQIDGIEAAKEQREPVLSKKKHPLWDDMFYIMVGLPGFEPGTNRL